MTYKGNPIAPVREGVREDVRERVLDYVIGALGMPLMDVNQLVSMVILHFDIVDEDARSLVMSVLMEIANGCKL
jgi:hypothetical protein